MQDARCLHHLQALCAHWLRHKTLVYKTGFLLTKRDSWFAIYHEKMMIDLLVYYGLQSEKELI